MNTTFKILFVLFLVFLVASMIRPGTRKDGTPFKRKDLAIGLGLISGIFLILVGITAPKQKQATLQADNTAQHSQNQADNHTASNQPQPSTSDAATPAAPSPPSSQPPATPTVDVAKVKSYLTDGTNYYIQLFHQAQQALGTTQYPDAYAGIVALDDPTSAASIWSQFNQQFAKTDYTGQATQAYNNASNLYTDANLNTPSAIGDWYNDINQAESDIGPWVNDATSWQIQSVPTSKLTADERQFQQDISVAQGDIAKL